MSDLSTDAFIASLRRFVALRGKPALIWSDHGSNFVGAARERRELVQFLESQKTQNLISEFCSSQNIQWKFIPECAPHFGGIWELLAMTFEEFTTVLAQIEACLNSRPLSPLPCDDDGVEALTPGHFLIGRPHCRIQHSRTARCLCYVVGICVSLSCAISGKDGTLNMSLLSDNSLSGIIPHGTPE